MRSAACAGPKALFERSDVGEQLVGQRFALGAKFGRTASISIVRRRRLGGRGGGGFVHDTVTRFVCCWPMIIRRCLR